MNEARFNNAFSSLKRDKMLVQTMITKSNNQTYDAYKLANE
jgi:hypothetical protein